MVMRIAHNYGNSRDRLELALEGQVDYIEADVWYHGGRLVVRHEHKLGPLPILFDEKPEDPEERGPGRCGVSLGRWYLKIQKSARYLEEVLAAVHDSCRVTVDVKGGRCGRQFAFARDLAQAVFLAGMADKVIFCGQNWPALRDLQVIAPDLHVHYSIGDKRRLDDFGRVHQWGIPRGVNLHRSLVDAQLVGDLKQQGLAIWVWTVDDLARAGELVSMGIDGIISNRLAVLAAL